MIEFIKINVANGLNIFLGIRTMSEIFTFNSIDRHMYLWRRVATGIPTVVSGAGSATAADVDDFADIDED